MRGPVSDGPTEFVLLDFGDGRRLERWGPVVLIRPDGRATGTRQLGPNRWAEADAAFEGRVGAGGWRIRRAFPQPWQVEHDGLRFEVRCAPSMHTGLFPEQAAHWRWLRDVTRGASLDVLTLFAYTGGASMALAQMGHRVTHVDASRPAIGWARRNAALNDLTTIRWIEDDARRFVARERRRGRRYDGLVLDPPAFGRGPAGAWRLDRDLPPLLGAAIALLSSKTAFVILNLYSQDAGVQIVQSLLADALVSHRLDTSRIDAAPLTLTTLDARTLPTGVYGRWTGRARVPAP